MNLLLASLDSVRQDHGPPWSPIIQAPEFVAQVRDFSVFDTCFTVASATRPVHASLLTGVYPTEHGVRGQRSPCLRPGLAEFLTTLATRDWAVTAFSEAPTVFTGLPFAHLLQHLDARPAPGLGQLRRAVSTAKGSPQALFVHYWSAHTPYGAADGQAFGEVARLLADGRLDEVRRRYARATTELFEAKLAPLLAGLDRSEWIIVIFSDHGESWTAEEPYHGQTLRNSVLRVPLYVHLPGRKPLDTRHLVSLLDVLPTLLDVLNIPFPNQLRGDSLLRPLPRRYCIAQIAPVSGPDLPATQRPPQPSPTADTGPLWAIFDARCKLTGYERSGRVYLQHTLSELPLDDPETAARMHAAYTALSTPATSAASDPTGPLPAADSVLDQRLRDLGYLA